MEYQDPEIVICAAVVAINGEVIRCHRHHDGFMSIQTRGLKPLSTTRAQGFVTSRNRFVSRSEAMDLQVAAGIKSASPDGYKKNGELHSEDLY